ncbi:MAG: ATP-binding protein [Bacteroidetes bacterium]|nr:ATP-binding protein [Bacteroidota bacterium]
MYRRDLENKLLNWMDFREILIIYGARQVGKTTLVDMFTSKYDHVQILNCENPVIFDILRSKDLVRIKSLFGDDHIIVLDEAQVVGQIGAVLKLIYDTFQEYKLIVTGSSSFDLLNKVAEPLTGRNIKFRLFPLSTKEILTEKNPLWIYEHLKDILVYGLYPGIIDLSPEKKIKKLEELIIDYLFKDLLAYESLKNSGVLRNLIKALALQTGNLVSMHELSIKLGITIPTVEKYIDLLEKTFVIFSLGAFSSNSRNEIRKSRKFYFYDNGIRNAVISNFSAPENRNDMGILWENFCITERMKINHLKPGLVNMFFWRTYDGAEIDLIEETDGHLTAYECKWNAKKQPGIPASFQTKYNTNQLHVLNPENFLQYFV